nr:helix-turn-helix transcriptional regulator [Anaerotalea alkaliphila]
MRMYRVRKGYTQEAFAALLGVDRSTVSKWENGEIMPRVQRLLQMAALLDVDVAALLEKDAQEKG